jgi:hypothetical protein
MANLQERVAAAIDHTGALLYPQLGYEQIGMLLLFAPKKAKSPVIG